MVFINSDTIWSKSNSPYSLTGPTVVNVCVTLTINSGVTVDFNGYTLYVNGTLIAVGTTADKIRLNGGNITFGDSASIYSRFENVIINLPITSSKPITFSGDTIYYATIAGKSSIFSANNISAAINAGNLCTLSNNNINGDVTVGDSCSITGNTITGDVKTGNSAIISQNTINGSKYQREAFGGFYYTVAVTAGNSSTITNNIIFGGVTAVSSSISGNTISGGRQFTDWAGRSEDATSALAISGTSTVTSNAIYSSTGGYGVTITDGSSIVFGNAIANSLRIAGNAVIDSNFLTGGIQVGDIYIPAFNDINYGSGVAIIKNNIINGSYYGISSSYVGGAATIQNNLISNCNYGISLISNATIQYNTIYNCQTAITLTNTAPPINYNNIMGYSQNSSLILINNPSNINATYNWWGTTVTQTIGLSIHDFKYDLNIGTVNYAPILTSQNRQAPATTYTLQVPAFTVIASPTPTQTSTENPTTSESSPSSGASSSSTPNPSPTSSIPGIMPLTMVIVIIASTMLTLLLIKNKKKNKSIHMKDLKLA